MCRVASDFSARRSANFSGAYEQTLSALAQSSSRVQPSHSTKTKALSTNAFGSDNGAIHNDEQGNEFSELYSRLSELSRQVAQLDTQLSVGSEMLERIRQDVNNRVNAIITTLQSKHNPNINNNSIDQPDRESLSSTTRNVSQLSDYASVSQDKIVGGREEPLVRNQPLDSLLTNSATTCQSVSASNSPARLDVRSEHIRRSDRALDHERSKRRASVSEESPTTEYAKSKLSSGVGFGAALRASMRVGGEKAPVTGHASTEKNEHPALLQLHNKPPFWNEDSQVYQLDFGGRVTQESAKNFQIEFDGKQVMQFGRIEQNAYTLDFEYPFSPVQAFAVALASITQRLK